MSSQADPKGRNTVRELARQIAALAASDENARRVRRWCDVNSLRRPDRPPVICHPGSGAWDELLPRSVLVATDPELAGLEMHFRRLLFKWEMGDDTVIEPWVQVATAMRLQGEHFWGLPVRHIPPAGAGGLSTRTAWQYDPPLRTEADIDRIVAPRYVHDPAATRDRIAAMQDLLGDLLPIRQTCNLPGPGAWLHGWATELRGVEQLLVDLMDRPEWVHRLMATLRDGFLGVMDQYEQAGVLTLNNFNLMSCDDLPQEDAPPAPVRLKHLWGRGESQEFQGVGPALYSEFLLEYQKPILERFGLTFYGCCEDLTRKIPLVLAVTNLRKFVCSAWTDLAVLAAAVGDRYCIEWRQKATDVVYAPDLSAVRAHLERGLTAARDCRIMVVLQELETAGPDRRRLHDWAAVAKDVGARVAG